ncbi:MAG: DUF5686 and carboxypeptidase regulatory-like domain-containing protein, partial [Flavobacteriaceae bacterium]|nr:DUF5686 and carboxypeptidase regulatory-like domain-containing protein [Flavobacteriaceae bacterium]
MKNYLVNIFLFLPFLIFSQSNFSGIIKDSKSKKALPFATIITNNGIGQITDTEGKFAINSRNNITKLTVSYVGYKTQIIKIDKGDKYITILLEPFNESLTEVVLLAKENPALKIIRKTIQNKNKNNIQKALNSFKYTAYNKLIVTANPDSISGNLDSVFVIKNGERIFKKVDSTNFEFKKQIEKHHLYITEKISEHKFQLGKNKKETVLASRMAGFQQPIYEFLALNIENFSFYDEVYTLLGNNYVNPLAKNALKNYNYQILDTIVHKEHSSYMIYYKPKKVKETVGLEGVLYINFETYALEKGIAELKGILNVKAAQSFNYLSEYKIWFPYETQISLRKGKNKENVALFGGVVKFSESSPKNDSIVSTKQKDPSDILYLISKTKIFDAIVNEPIKVLNSAAIIEIDENAPNRDEDFWNKYRTDSLTIRGVQAYQIIDSLSQKEGVEKKLNIGRKIFQGYFPTTYFDFDLSKLINFNNYEGFRFGFGVVTNPNFSKGFKFEGYTTYGIKDHTVKYHLGAYIRLSKQNNTWIGTAYTDDLQEAGKLDFLFENTSFSIINPRNLNISQFYNYKTININLQHDIFPNLESKLKFEHGSYLPKFNYEFISDNTFSDYKLSLATFALQWTPYSKYMNSPIGKLQVKKGYPKITAQVLKSFENLFDGNFNFTQLNFKIEHTIESLGKNSTSFLVQGGYV